MKVIFEFDFIKDMYRQEKDELLKDNSMERILEIAIDNCFLMSDREFYNEYGLDANPDDYCYEVIYSGEYIKSFWFSIDQFWNDWYEFKTNTVLERFK